MIAPIIASLLKRKFIRVVPIYYWSNLEGNSFSSTIHNGKKLQLLSVFPRRPKLKNGNSKLVLCKINDSIIEYSEAANSFGIPTICCFPVITSLYDLADDSPLITMNVTNYEPMDSYFNIDKESLEINFESNQEN
ncbi:MAG: hypothetical protein WAR79_12920 [Melioribacteraceae bacterium]